MKYNIFAAFILSCSLAFCGPIQLLVKSSPAALGATNTVSFVLGVGGEITEIVIHDCPTNAAATVSASASYAEGNMLRDLTTVSIDATNTVGYASVTNGYCRRVPLCTLSVTKPTARSKQRLSYSRAPCNPL